MRIFLSFSFFLFFRSPIFLPVFLSLKCSLPSFSLKCSFYCWLTIENWIYLWIGAMGASYVSAANISCSSYAACRSRRPWWAHVAYHPSEASAWQQKWRCQGKLWRKLRKWHFDVSNVISGQPCLKDRPPSFFLVFRRPHQMFCILGSTAVVCCRRCRLLPAKNPLEISPPPPKKNKKRGKGNKNRAAAKTTARNAKQVSGKMSKATNILDVKKDRRQEGKTMQCNRNKAALLYLIETTFLLSRIDFSNVTSLALLQPPCTTFSRVEKAFQVSAFCNVIWAAGVVQWYYVFNSKFPLWAWRSVQPIF